MSDEHLTHRTGAFRYVLWHQVELHHRNGWMVVADLGLSHGQYSVLMWRCDCPTALALAL